MTKLFELLIESQKDEAIKSTSIIIKLIYDDHIQTYYMPAILMKIISPSLYTKKEIELRMKEEEKEELFLEVCEDALKMEPLSIPLFSKKSMLQYAISKKIKSSIYVKFTTPQFIQKGKYDEYIEMISEFPEYSEMVLKQYYRLEKPLFLYELMDKYDVKISCEMLEGIIIFLEQSKYYKLDILSKFGDVYYIYKGYKGEWHHYWYAYASIKKCGDDYSIKGPYLKKEESTIKLDEWYDIKKDLEEKIYTPYAKTIRFDRDKISFDGIYFMEKQKEDEFISKCIKVILSQEGREDRKILYLPEKLLKKIDETYFEIMTRAIESKVYSDCTEFEIYFSDGETIESFLLFLYDFLKESKQDLTFCSKEEIQKFIIAHRFSKEYIYEIPSYSHSKTRESFIKKMTTCIPTTSPFFKILIEKLIESGYFKGSYQDILTKYGIAL